MIKRPVHGFVTFTKMSLKQLQESHLDIEVLKTYEMYWREIENVPFLKLISCPQLNYFDAAILGSKRWLPTEVIFVEKLFGATNQNKTIDWTDDYHVMKMIFCD